MTTLPWHMPGPAVRDDDGLTTYEPFIGTEGQVGYRCVYDDGRITFLYLNASRGSDDDDGVATVFVYQDDSGDPCSGQTLHYYDTWENA